jgi:hypothetical protein
MKTPLLTTILVMNPSVEMTTLHNLRYGQYCLLPVSLKNELNKLTFMYCKKIIAIGIIFLFLATSSFAQKTNNADTVIHKPILEDYSNRKQSDLSSFKQFYEKYKGSIIVIIDNKQIVYIDNKQFRALSQENIASIDIIKDDQSKTPIKAILFITTK